MGVAPFESIYAPSLAQDPSNPRVLCLSTHAPGMSAVHLSEDGGLTWQELIGADDSEFLGYIHVAPNHPEQLHLRATTVSGASFTYATWHSGDPQYGRELPPPLEEPAQPGSSCIGLVAGFACTCLLRRRRLRPRRRTRASDHAAPA